MISLHGRPSTSNHRATQLFEIVHLRHATCVAPRSTSREDQAVFISRLGVKCLY